MADVQADVEAVVAAATQLKSDFEAAQAPDPDVEALKSAAVAYAVSQGYTAPVAPEVETPAEDATETPADEPAA